MRAEQIGAPLFAEYAGRRFSTGKVISRRIRCAGCRTLFFPYLAEGIEIQRPVVLVTETLAACPRCGQAGNPRLGRAWGEFSDLRVRWSSASCSPDCEEATGSECKCSCDGANHGTRA